MAPEIGDEEVAVDPWLTTLLPEARNLMIVPLAEGHAVGALVAEHDMQRGLRVERRVVAMVERFASHGALALYNAWLLEQVQELAATSTRSNGISSGQHEGPRTSASRCSTSTASSR